VVCWRSWQIIPNPEKNNMSQMFSNSGEINASSLKDAIGQIARFASILEDNQPSNIGLAGQPSMSDTAHDDLITRAINTADGKVALAQAIK